MTVVVNHALAVTLKVLHFNDHVQEILGITCTDPSLTSHGRPVRNNHLPRFVFDALLPPLLLPALALPCPSLILSFPFILPPLVPPRPFVRTSLLSTRQNGCATANTMPVMVIILRVRGARRIGVRVASASVPMLGHVWGYVSRPVVDDVAMYEGHFHHTRMEEVLCKSRCR